MLPNRTLGDEMNYRLPSTVTPKCDEAEVAAAAALSHAITEDDLAVVGPLPTPTVVNRRRGRVWFERARLVAVAVGVAVLVVLAAGWCGYGVAVARRPLLLPSPDLGGYRLAVPSCDPDQDVCRVRTR